MRRNLIISAMFGLSLLTTLQAHAQILSGPVVGPAAVEPTLESTAPFHGPVLSTALSPEVAFAKIRQLPPVPTTGFSNARRFASNVPLPPSAETEQPSRQAFQLPEPAISGRSIASVSVSRAIYDGIFFSALPITAP